MFTLYYYAAIMLPLKVYYATITVSWDVRISYGSLSSVSSVLWPSLYALGFNCVILNDSSIKYIRQ